MNRLLAFVGGACIASSLWATGFPYMVIKEKDGSETIVPSVGTEFRCSDGTLTVAYTGGSEMFALADLASMKFSETAGLSEIMAGEVGASVDVFTVSGVHVGNYPDATAAYDGLTDGGVYIFRTGGKTFRILVAK